MQELLTLSTKIKSVIDGEVEKVSLPFTPIEEIEEVLIKLGIDTDDAGYDSNGWQVDFWYTYGDYQLSGSLHYGGFVFSKVYSK